MANKDFAYCWIARLRWTEYPVCTTILRIPALLHIVSTKRLVFGKPAHMTESFIELTREDYLKGISVCCDK